MMPETLVRSGVTDTNCVTLVRLGVTETDDAGNAGQDRDDIQIVKYWSGLG